MGHDEQGRQSKPSCELSAWKDGQQAKGIYSDAEGVGQMLVGYKKVMSGRERDRTKDASADRWY